MCKKQTSVLHSSTEAKVIFLDARFRMDGIHVLDLWDLEKVMHSSKNVPARGNPSRDETKVLARRKPSRDDIQSKHANTKTKRHGIQENEELSNVDHVVTSAKPCPFEAMLFIFEDNKAVIELDHKIQINYVDSKNQLADLLTQGNFTRDEWNHFLRLFNILSFSVFSCSDFKSINKSKIMSKRQQEGKPGEERVVAKSKPMMSLVPKNANRSPMLDSGVSNSPEWETSFEIVEESEKS